MPKAIAQRFADLRQEKPHLTTELLLDILIKEGSWNGVRPSRSAFYRLAKNKGLKRKPLGAAVLPEAHAFAYDAFG